MFDGTMFTFCIVSFVELFVLSPSNDLKAQQFSS